MHLTAPSYSAPPVVVIDRNRWSPSAGTSARHRRNAQAAHEELVRRLLAQQPDITLAELKAILAKRRVKVGQTSIFRFLRHLKLTFKKKPARRRAGSARRRGRSQGLAKEATKARPKAAGFH